MSEAKSFGTIDDADDYVQVQFLAVTSVFSRLSSQVETASQICNDASSRRDSDDFFASSIPRSRVTASPFNEPFA